VEQNQVLFDENCSLQKQLQQKNQMSNNSLYRAAAVQDPDQAE